MAEPADGLNRLLETLDRMEIPYAVGGSVASGVHGIPRTTMDIDLVVDMRPDQLEEFAMALHPGFYADAETIRRAVALGRAFNVIHIASAYKFDFFPLGKDEFSRTEFARRAYAEVSLFGPEPIECAVASAEDTILRTLEWYRRGGETSERQWNDVRGIIQVSGDQLDYPYLRRWAKHLRVDDLLEQLLAE
jgi:hypothetical protein